jgi:transposase
MCTCSSFKTFPEFNDIIYIYPLLQFTGFPTVHKEMYINILRHIRNAVRRKLPEEWRTNSWFLLHDNASTHWSVLVKDFSSMNNVTIQEHLLYSPDLALADFYLFLQLILALKGWGFCYATDILNPLNPELNPICYLLALLAHHFLHVSRIRDKSLTLR